MAAVSRHRCSLVAADLTRVAAFAALIAALGLPGTHHLLGNAVPITAQTLGVMMAGAIIGPYLGALSVLTFIALVAAGLPLLSGGRGGITWLTSAPSAGYLWGWVLGALVIGLLTRLALPKYHLWLGIGANILGGMVVVYAAGVPYQAWRLHSGLLAVAQACAIYLPGDLVKAIVAAAVARQVHRALPGLAGSRSEPR